MNVWGGSWTLNVLHCAHMQGSDVAPSAVMGQNNGFPSLPIISCVP